jgi:TRAP-type transport system small permease protein
MKRFVERYFQLLSALTALCLLVMVVLVFGNVVLRYGFNRGIAVSEELSRWLFVYVTFLGAIVAMREHGHLGVDSLVKRLPPIGRKICLVASLLLMLLATGLFLQGSWLQTRINLGSTAPASGLSVGYLYGVGIVFSVSVGLILLHELYRVLTGKVRDEDLVIVKESEEQAELEELQRELRRPQ